MPPTELDIAERIVRLETKLDFIIAQIDKLPPSPICTAKHRELEDRLDTMETWRNRIVGALFVANILVVLFIDKIKKLFIAP